VHDGVAGVGAAGHAHNHVVRLRQAVDQLALAFVAPLGTQHHVHAGVQAVRVAVRVGHGALDAVELGQHVLECGLRGRLNIHRLLLVRAALLGRGLILVSTVAVALGVAVGASNADGAHERHSGGHRQQAGVAAVALASLASLHGWPG